MALWSKDHFFPLTGQMLQVINSERSNVIIIVLPTIIFQMTFYFIFKNQN